MRIAVTGSHGLIGSALARALEGDGHQVVRVVRSEPSGRNEVFWDPATGKIDVAGLAGVEAAVHLAGKGIGRIWWTESHKARILDSRVRSTHLLSETLASLDPKPGVLVSASAVGFYGDRGNELLDEDSQSGAGVVAEVCRQWEASAQPARDAGIRVATPRSGIVLSSGGGALQIMLIPFRLGLGGRLGGGKQYWPWISIDDEVRALTYILKSDLSGPVNLVSPIEVTNSEFTHALGRALHRPAVVRVPEFAIKAAVGPDMANEMLLLSQRVVPKKLLASGFEFEWPDLEVAFRHLVGRT
jgi:uncharacterized protein